MKQMMINIEMLLFYLNSLLETNIIYHIKVNNHLEYVNVNIGVICF